VECSDGKKRKENARGVVFVLFAVRCTLDLPSNIVNLQPPTMYAILEHSSSLPLYTGGEVNKGGRTPK